MRKALIFSATQLPTQLPEGHRYDLNLPDIAEVWRRGSVISSWLLDLTAMALAENPTLSEYTGIVQDSGEGRWTVTAALEEAVPADVLTAALYTRFRSRQDHTFAEKMLSAMRQKFGGHIELTQKERKSFLIRRSRLHASTRKRIAGHGPAAFRLSTAYRPLCDGHFWRHRRPYRAQALPCHL